MELKRSLLLYSEMEDDQLHNDFMIACDRVSQTTQKFPPDVLLRFYALYKRATQDKNYISSQEEHELISAFKSNAVFQVQHLSINEAKQKYIEVANTYLKEG